MFKLGKKVFGAFKSSEPAPGTFSYAFNKQVGMTPGSLAGNTAFFTAINMASGQDSLGTSVAKGLVDTALWKIAPGPYLAYSAAGAIFQGVKAGYKLAEDNKSKFNSMHYNNVLGGNYTDTQHNLYMRQAGMQAIQMSNLGYQRAATQRQAAVQAIQGSKLNARSALGSEATLMHIPR